MRRLTFWLAFLLILTASNCRAQVSGPGAKYIESGNRLAQGGDFDGAINAFGKAIELDPKSDAAYLARGNARLKKSELEKDEEQRSKIIDEAIADFSNVGLRLN